jgi:hypothetical protein
MAHGRCRSISSLLGGYIFVIFGTLQAVRYFSLHTWRFQWSEPKSLALQRSRSPSRFQLLRLLSMLAAVEVALTLARRKLEVAGERAWGASR